MPIDIERKWNEALTLSEAGRFREANVLLRQILPEAADPTIRLICARLVAREMLIDIKKQGRFPDIGTRQHDELCNYLRAALESYDLADGPAKQDAEDDMIRFRRILQDLTTSQTARQAPRNREEAIALIAARIMQLSVQYQNDFLFVRSTKDAERLFLTRLDSQSDFDNADNQIIEAAEIALSGGRQVAISAAGPHRLLLLVSKAGKGLFI